MSRLRARLILVLSGLLVAGVAAGADAQAGGQRYAVLIQGASGEPTYATLHRKWLDGLIMVLRDRFKYEPARLIVLSEQPKADEQRATSAIVKDTLTKLAASIQPADQLVLVLIGHGGGEGANAAFNLIGPDLNVGEWAALLKPIRGRIAVVDTTSASFPFLAGLSGEGRVVITATSTNAQRFHTQFPDGFVQAFSSDEADADKNGRVSLLEAFTYASNAVKLAYAQKGTMATEVAVLDDDGDGKGRDAASTGPDGAVAALTYLDRAVTQTSADPETQKLLTRQQALTEEIDELRRRQSSMPAAEFDKEYERLVAELAVVSRDVRRRTGGAQ